MTTPVLGSVQCWNCVLTIIVYDENQDDPKGGGRMKIKDTIGRGLAMHGVDNIARSDPRGAAELMMYMRMMDRGER